MKFIYLALINLFFYNIGYTQENLASELDFFGGQSKTNIRNIQELRDPFRKPIVKSMQKSIQRGPRTSFVENVPSIEGVPLGLVRIVGVLLGEERRAIAKIISTETSIDESDGPVRFDDETYILREGMKIGENQAEIKAILPGGIVLVEKIRNIYDQDEYLETIIPLTLQ
jgi:Tfp pilus assembly protein PilP